MLSEPVTTALVSQDVADLLSGAGDVAQVVIAIAALYLAWRANKISHGAIFIERAIGELIDLRAQARQIQLLYEALFEPFADRAGKVAARTQWLRAREALTMHLEYLVCAFPELEPLRDPWQTWDDEEDSHARSDATDFVGNRSNVVKKYERLCAQFIRRSAECIKDLRLRHKP